MVKALVTFARTTGTCAFWKWRPGYLMAPIPLAPGPDRLVESIVSSFPRPLGRARSGLLSPIRNREQECYEEERFDPPRQSWDEAQGAETEEKRRDCRGDHRANRLLAPGRADRRA